MLPDWTIRYQYFKIIKQYFESKYDVADCQLFFSLLKSRSLTIVRRILGIKIVRCLETSSHIFRKCVDAFQKIGQNTHFQDRNVSQHVLS